ncbi:MAG: PIN domain-containing protein [bacterium]
MRKVLIDINIILDILNKRDDHESAARIFDMCVKRSLKGFLCSHEITTLSYFMEKYKYPNDKRVYIINKILDVFSIIPATEKILRDSLQSGISDYEDAVIETSAKYEEVDMIITRNIKDFKESNLVCCTAVEALAIIGG